MRKGSALPVAIFVLASLLLPPLISAQSVGDGVVLSVSKGPAAGQVTLQWTGGFNPFTVYRATDPATVTNPANQIAVLDDSIFIHSPSAAIPRVFYAVQGLTLQSIEVAPVNTPLPAGFTQQFTATATLSDGSTRDITDRVVWSSSDAAIATVSNAASLKGLVTSVAAGTTLISAQLSGVAGSTTLTVTNATLDSVEVSPPNSNLPIGFTVHYTAIGTFSDGQTLDITERATWTSSAPALASVSNAASSKGLATGLTPGTTQISAESDGVTGAATLTVTDATLVSVEVSPPNSNLPIGFTVHYTAIGTFSDGQTLDITERATWTSSIPAVATVSNGASSKGLATGLSNGTTQISAESDGVTGATTLTVTDATLSAIEVAPPSLRLPVGLSLHYTATGNFSDGQTLDITERATWTSSAPTIASVSNAASSKGLATGLSNGTTQITATVGSVAGGTGLTVTGATFEAIEVSPPSSNLPAGITRQLTATATFSDGTTADVTAHVTWTSSAPTIASVSNAAASKGLATPVAAGTTLITASYGSVSGGTLLTVTGATFSSIEVSPPNSNLPAGFTIHFTATATLSDGTTEDVTSHVTWSSSAPTIASVSNAAGSRGQLTGVAPGVSTITASFGSVSGGTLLTVTGATFSSIEVSPPNSNLPAGLTRQLTATATMSDGTTEDVTNHVTWSSSAPTIASVSNAAGTRGQLTGVAPGTSTITASYGSVSGGTLLTVTGATFSAIEVSPTGSNLPAGFTIHFTATATMSDGTTEDVTSHVTWSSSAPTIASVSNAAGARGQLTGVAPGVSTITASFGSVSGGTLLTVTGATLQAIEVAATNSRLPVGFSQAYTAIGTFSDGTTREISAHATWTSSNPAFATISNADASKGVASPVSPGTTQISATVGGIAGGTTLTIIGDFLEAIEVSPFGASLPAGYRRQFQATATLSDGSTLDVTQHATWTSSDPGIATVSNAGALKGQASGVSFGTLQIGAKVGSVVGGTVLTVTGTSLQSVEVTPASSTLSTGRAQAYTATGIYADGSSDDLTDQVTWTSSDSAIASISNAAASKGVVTTNNAGTAVINARSGSVLGGTVLTISGATLLAIEVSPPGSLLPEGFTVQAAAIGTFADGRSDDVTDSVTWSSSSPAVASISNAAASKGLATGLAPGLTQLSAQSGSVIGGTVLTISGAFLVAIEVAPFDGSLPIGFSQRYTAIGTFSDGSSRDLTERATWTSSNPGFASVSNTGSLKGVATGVAPGLTQISVHSDGVSGATTLTVTSATLVAVEVSPQNPSLPANGTQQLIATCFFSDGSTLDVTERATWTTSDPGIATVSNAEVSRGLVTTNAAGNAQISAQTNGVSGATTVTVTAGPGGPD